MRSNDHPIAAVALIALLAGACGGAARSAPAPEPVAERPARTDQPSAAEIEALYEARMDSARMKFTEADVRFMTGMIAHHAQALVMSNMAPTHEASPQIRTLAARIINAQRDEIATMQSWLRDRGQPVPEVHVDGTELMIHGPGHGMHMPGMLTDEQLAELDRARGPEFDRLFLHYMIQHHTGAVTMVRDLMATDGAAQGDVVFKFASDIQADQSSEVGRMERMLAELTPTGGAP